MQSMPSCHKNDMNFMFHGDWVRLLTASGTGNSEAMGQKCGFYACFSCELHGGKGPSEKWFAKIIKIAMERPTFFFSMIKVCQIKSDQFSQFFWSSMFSG